MVDSTNKETHVRFEAQQVENLVKGGDIKGAIEIFTHMPQAEIADVVKQIQKDLNTQNSSLPKIEVIGTGDSNSIRPVKESSGSTTHMERDPVNGNSQSVDSASYDRTTGQIRSDHVIRDSATGNLESSVSKIYTSNGSGEFGFIHDHNAGWFGFDTRHGDHIKSESHPGPSHPEPAPNMHDKKGKDTLPREE